jgi:hypothetical protein
MNMGLPWGDGAEEEGDRGAGIGLDVVVLR